MSGSPSQISWRIYPDGLNYFLSRVEFVDASHFGKGAESVSLSPAEVSALLGVPELEYKRRSSTVSCRLRRSASKQPSISGLSTL